MDAVRTQADRSLAGRLMAHVGSPLSAMVVGVGVIDGEVAQSTATWCEVAGTRTWYIPHTSIASVRGLKAEASRKDTWPHLARLSFASPLRHLMEGREHVIVHTHDGARSEGLITEVASDYIEMRVVNGNRVVVSMTYVASVSKGGRSPSTS